MLFAPYPRRHQAHRLRARWWTLHVHWCGRAEVRRDGLAGVRSPGWFRPDAGASSRSDPAALPGAQSARGGEDLRAGLHGTRACLDLSLDESSAQAAMSARIRTREVDERAGRLHDLSRDVSATPWPAAPTPGRSRAPSPG